jgi:glycerol-3-phosphate dehydrogenase
MRRATDRLANETFDILVIGGGITGACVARDASMRGLKVALVERNDFANATSAHNSKLIHGGLRYLRNFEFGLVRESLRERRIWQRIAPHLVHPLPFLVPLYGGGWKARATLSAGLTLYDVLSYDRGWLDDPAQRLPGHSWLSANEARQREPVLDQPGLQGAFLYYDAQMDSPERLALECLIDADTHGAAIANYAEAGRLLMRNGKVEGCTVRDTVSGASFDIRAKATLVATGPWADIFLEHAISRPSSHKLLRSKGIHVLVPPITREFALTMATAHGHFFVLPWRGHTLLGTTDTAFKGDPDTLGVSENDIATFFAFINKHLPNAALTRDKVEYFYAGLRPLVADGNSDTYGASRKSELVDHGKDDGLDGLFSAIGGKWTTSRHLAETVVDRLAEKLDAKTDDCRTADRRLPGVAIPNDTEQQVSRAVHLEMARTLEDVVMRRTGIGQFGRPASETLDTVSRLMTAQFGWSEERRQREIAMLDRLYATREAA